MSTAGQSALRLAEFVAGIAFFGIFIVHERRAADPIVPPRLYANRVIVWTNAIGLLLATVQYSALVLLPVFFQLVGGVSATTSGLMIIPMLVVVPIASIVAGQIMARTGRYRLILPVAFALMCVAFVSFAGMATGRRTAVEIEFAVMLLGYGIGSCGPVLMTATQNAAVSGDIGAATSSVTFSRSLGASFGTAAFWAILLAPLGSGAAGATDALFHGGHAGLALLPPTERLRVIALVASGFRDVFALSACVALGTAIFALFLREEALKTTSRSAAAAVLSEQLE